MQTVKMSLRFCSGNCFSSKSLQSQRPFGGMHADCKNRSSLSCMADLFQQFIAVTVIVSGGACGLQKCLHFSSAGVGRACCSFAEKIGDLPNFQVDANSCTVAPEIP